MTALASRRSHGVGTLLLHRVSHVRCPGAGSVCVQREAHLLACELFFSGARAYAERISEATEPYRVIEVSLYHYFRAMESPGGT